MAQFDTVLCQPGTSVHTVHCVSHLLTHLVVYIIARRSSLNTTTFCLFPVCPVLPHPTYCIAMGGLVHQYLAPLVHIKLGAL